MGEVTRHRRGCFPLAAQRHFLLLLAVFLLQGCASNQEVTNSDPYEPFNRKIFAFNEGLDRQVLSPLARGYRAVMPDFAEQGVRNFFANLRDFNSALNAVLQFRLEAAARSSGRFLVNSTWGLLGAYDVASELGIDPYHTDFGHTLAIWGSPSGPYLVAPAFGPLTARSGTGMVMDLVLSVQSATDDTVVRVALAGLEVVDYRADLSEAETLISGDRYLFIRDVFLQQRQALVSDGELQDSFSDFEEEFDWEE